VILAGFLGMVLQNMVDPDEANFNEQLGLFMPVLRSYLRRPGGAGGDLP
jgi:hypothetical protein